MDSPFLIQEHIFKGQHIREYPNALAKDQHDGIRLSVKQYVPINNQQPQPGDATIIATHANGFCREVYEPMWEQFLLHGAKVGLRIRAIWIMDEATQGASGVLNEDIAGNDHHVTDTSRDLLLMVNEFRDQITRPIFGVGHSIGAGQLVSLSHIHPRLFSSLALIEPAISLHSGKTLATMLHINISRRDLYPDLETAVTAVSKAPVFRKWDKRALHRYLATAFRTTPTAIYPDSVGEVTLRTTKHSEMVLYGRPNLEMRSMTAAPTVEELSTHPDLDPDATLSAPVYSHISRQNYYKLRTLRPSVFYLLGQGSEILPPHMRAERTATTGTGPGGSGGVRLGRVKATEIVGGHFVPMTNVEETAREVAGWLEGEWRRWIEEEERWKKEWVQGIGKSEKLMTRKEVVDVLRKWDGTPWTKKRIEKL